MTMKIEYTSNNSGGSWWLKDADWLNLEKAGWAVEWAKDIKSDYFHADENGRWLGALAKRCSKDFNSPADAMREFEKITSQDVSDDGCNCCGAPHEFSWDGGYASGSDCLQYLFQNAPKTLREAAEKLNTK